MLSKGEIVLADDDPDDRLMATEAAEETGMDHMLVTVEDGEKLLDYLRNLLETDSDRPLPGLILLDLNMPRMSGKEALAEIRSHPELCQVPVVILTTSGSHKDVLDSYELGVNSFIVKPDSYAGLIDVMNSLRSYWFNTVRLPGK